MKKLLFLAVSVILAGTSYCISAGEKIIVKTNNNQIQQQEQGLILEQSSAQFNLLADHYSHSSHSSHGSHRSHSSHYSSW